jgi:hypothetical protein
MSEAEARQFERYLRKPYDDEIATSVKAHGLKVSMWGAKRISPVGDVFVLALFGLDGTVGPFALNRTTATQLRKLLEQEGY